MTDLPVNIDTSYADSGTDATVKTHQQHHDAVHALYNNLAGATPNAAAVPALTPTVGTSLATTGTVNLDMATLNGTYQSIAATGNITFTTSNRAAGRTVTIKIAAGAAGRTITLPAWILVGSAVALAASKTGILTVTFFDTTDAAAVAAWAVQE